MQTTRETRAGDCAPTGAVVAGRDGRGVAGAAVGLGAWLVALLAWRLLHPAVGWTIFADRDLVRGLDWASAGEALGAEVGGSDGARIPGGVQPMLTWVALQVATDAAAVQRMLHGFETAGLVLLAWAVARALGGGAAGWFGGLVGAGLALGAAPGPHALLQPWNPAFLPGFAALSAVGLARFVTTGRVAWAAAGALGLALATQVHLSAAIWGLAGLLVLPAAPRALRGLGVGVLVTVAAYAPYLVEEAAAGWPNTRLLLAGSAGGGGLVDPRSTPWTRLAALPVLLGSEAPAEAPWLRYTLPLAVVAGLACADRRRTEAGARGVLAVGAAALLAAVAVQVGSRADVPRYLLVVVPGLALVGGYGAGALVRGAEARSAAVATALAFAIGGASAATTAWWWGARHGAGAAWASVVDTVEAIRAEMGWSATEVAGRVTWAHVEPDGVVRVLPFPMDFLLRREGTAFPGSLPPPCGLVVPAEADVDAEALRAALLDPAATPRLSDRIPLGPSALLRWDPGTGRCPTSAVDAYVEGPVERAMRVVRDDVVPGGAARAPAPSGVTRWVAAIPGQAGPVWVAVDAGDGSLTLHGPALRGRAIASRWGEVAWVDRPRVRFTCGGADAEVVLHPGRVGEGAAAPPLTVLAPLPPGPCRVTLEVDGVRDRAGEAGPVLVVLDEAWRP